MHILTVCQRGNVRSVAMAYLLKDEMGYKDVIAIGVDTTTAETWNMLGQWADKIYVVAEMDVMQKVPERFWNKVIHLNIGRDVWGNPTHPGLHLAIKQKAAEKSRNMNFS